MSDKEKTQWTVDIKEIPHHFAVMIKDIEKASGMHKASARREELLEKVRNQLDDIIQNSPSNNFKKIDDYIDHQKTTIISTDTPYTRDVKKYEPPVTKKTTPAKTVKPVKRKTRKRKTNGRKGYSVKCGYCGKRGHNARTCPVKKRDERRAGKKKK